MEIIMVQNSNSVLHCENLEKFYKVYIVSLSSSLLPFIVIKISCFVPEEPWPSSVLQTEFQAVTWASRFVSVRNNSPQPRRANCRSEQEEEAGASEDDERDRHHEAGRKASKKVDR